ncbi:MAG: DNA polymerase III subunit delta [Candidatus Pacebacteria bacterium]|nr:DNA polymerase III subunit delta [Candidatus Paceibacterota bacterium]MDD4333890.1 DNA polymerase III subunit delta [Candidatus Paceibacterota bacterium]
MIILLYGKDTYRSKQRLNELKQEFKNESGINERFLDAKNLTFEELKNEVLGLSFFNEKKLIIVENVFLNKTLKEEIKEKGKDFLTSENIIIFYEQNKILKADLLYSFIRKKGTIEEFNFLEEEELKNWVLNEIEKEGGMIGDSALNLLCEYAGNDLWRQKNEISKLIAFSKEKITEKEIKLLINIETELNIFNTVEAIANNDKGKAIRLIKKHLDKGESIFGILALISIQFKNMIIVKTAEDYRRTSLSPFLQRKSFYQSEKFSLEDLKRIYAKIVEIDISVKTGKIDEKIAIETLILNI